MHNPGYTVFSPFPDDSPTKFGIKDKFTIKSRRYSPPVPKNIAGMYNLKEKNKLALPINTACENSEKQHEKTKKSAEINEMIRVLHSLQDQFIESEEVADHNRKLWRTQCTLVYTYFS